MNDFDFIERLRSRRPPVRTSTWREDSANAVFGTAVEIVARDNVQRVIDSRGLRWRVVRFKDPSVVNPFELGALPVDPEVRFIVQNAYGGDLYVTDHYNRTRFTIEVKGSQKHEGASITEGQLLHSEAQYLVAITTAGLWACTMTEARRRARDFGQFWVILYGTVARIPLEEMFQ